MIRFSTWPSVAVGASIAGLAPAMALASAPPAVAADLTAAQVFRLADEARAAGRIDQAISFYEALTQDPDPDIRSEARFRKGMTLAEVGRFREAALAFRALLDEKPEASRVRLELARVLAAMGDERGARRALRQARAAGLPPDVATVVDQFAGALAARKPYGGSFSLAIAPDTNINRATSARELDTVVAPLNLDEAARARSGVGVKTGAQVYARKALDSRLSLLAQASVSATLYKERDFDDVSASLVVGPEIQWGADRWRPAAGVTSRWYGSVPYADTRTLQVNWLHPLGGRTQVVTDLALSEARYRLNDLQDGRITQLTVSLEHAFSSRSGGSVTLDAGRQTARDPGYATTSGGIGLLGWREIGRITLFGTASYSHLEGDERLMLFRAARREDFTRVSAGVHLRQLKFREFAPVFRVAQERNTSTVGIYDYRRTAIEVGVERVF